MAAEGKLEILAILKDKASGKLAKLKGLASGIGGALKKGALIGGVALVGLGVAAFKFGNEFQKAFNTIAVGTGATGEDLAGLKADFKAALADIPGDIQQVAKATADWNTLTGESGVVLQELVKRSSEAARMVGEELGPMTDVAARAFNVFELTGAEMVVALDDVFEASQATGVPMTKLLGLVQTFGPVLKNAGFNLAETTAFMGSLEKSGIDVTRVMPGLNNFMRKLASEGITDLKGGLFDVIEEIKGAESASEALNIATEAFGAEGAQRMSVAVRTGALDIGGLTASMAEQRDSILATADATATWQEKLKILRNRVLVKLEPVLTKLVEAVGDLAEWLGDKIPVAIDAFVLGFNNAELRGEGFLGTMIALGRAVRTFIDGAIPVIKRFASAFVEGLRTIKPIFEFIFNNKAALIAALIAIGIAFLFTLGPIGLAVVAIVALIAIIGLVRQNFDAWRATVEEFVDAVITKVESIPVLGEIFKATVQVIGDKITALRGFIQGLIDFVTELVRFVDAIIRGDWATAWDALKNLAQISLGLFLDFLQLTFIGTIRSVLKALNVWALVKSAFSTAKDNMIGAFTDAKDGILGALRTVKDTLGGIMRGINNVIKAGINTGIHFLNRFILGFERIINAVAGGINAIPDINLPFGIGSISIPHVPTVSLPRIPRLEKGGRVVETGLAVVHEGEHFTRGGASVTVNIGRVGVGVTDDELRSIARRTQRIWEDEFA